MPPITELTIVRSQWDKGALKRRDNGKMCCLGFLSLACGVPKTELFNTGSEIGYPYSKWISQYGLNSQFAERSRSRSTAATRAATINDSEQYTQQEKEEKLTKLFAENGIALTFVD